MTRSRVIVRTSTKPPVVPPGGPTAPEWNAVTAFKARTDPGVDGEAGQILSVGPAGIIWHRQPYVDAAHPRFGSSFGIGDDTAAIQAALTAGAGKTVIVSGTHNITTLTMPSANTHLELAAGAVLTKTTATTDGIAITGANCSISGPGKIVAPALWDGTNVAWTYAVVQVLADGFAARGVTLENVPKVGIGIRANDAQILGCRILGNYPSASWTGVETAHFGIAYDPTTTAPRGNLVITGNIIRSCVQGAFIGNYGSGGPTQGVTISANTFEGCWNHGVYARDGVGHVISTNAFSRCQVPVVVIGARHVIAHNTMVTDGTGAQNDMVGISVRNAQSCLVTGNVLKGDAGVGQIISLPAIESAAAVTDNIVEGNIIECTAGEASAITIGSDTLATAVSGNIVRNNIIKVPVRQFLGVITVTAPSGVRGAHNQVVDNTITFVAAKEAYALLLLYQDHALVAGNTIRWECDAASPVTMTTVRLFDSIDCAITRNRQIVTAAWGANITIRGHREEGTSDYNLVAENQYLYDLTKLAGASALFALGANSIRRDNRTARAWPSNETGTGAPTATRPNGSEYTDLTTGKLYRRESGAWVAK